MGLFDGISSAVESAASVIPNLVAKADAVANPFSWSSFIPSAIGAVGSYIGAEQTNKASAEQAQKMMDFQERMSNTAHQREVKDLIASGLNPMLSAKLGGASSPGGSMAPIQNVLGSATASASQNYQLESQAKLIRAQETNTLAQADLTNTNNLVELSKMPGYQKYGEQVDALIKMQLNNALASAAQARQQSALGALTEKGIAPSSDPYWYRDLKRILEKGMNSAPQNNPLMKRIEDFGKKLNY
jgi:hypothetical protein